MEKRIILTDHESSLRQLLLDACTYIGTKGDIKPELRFTGGWVRDKLLGTTSVDIDVGIKSMTGFEFGCGMQDYLALPESKARYPNHVLGSLAKIKANPEKSKHLETVTTKMLGFDIDLVNLRKETYLENSRTPVMKNGSPEEDALRRDATINALFYNLSTSQVEDLTGRGLEDLERKVIKTPLAPLQTFRDDPLRVLRAIRFASRLTFTIADEDKEAMGDNSIKDALKLKISRERIGVEVTKMLKGPNPHYALSLLNGLDLYNVVFTKSSDEECSIVSTARWSYAYDQLAELVKANAGESAESSSLPNLSRLLLRSEEDAFLAWIIVCFVPWAREPLKDVAGSTLKKLLSAAAKAAREGIKADNKITKLVDDAASCLQEIIAMKDTVTNSSQPTSPSLKRKRQTPDRLSQGLAVRRWGSNWRSSVIFALLTQVGESETSADAQKILNDYAAWLMELESLDLLNVDQLKPIVQGNQLSKALEVETGPWMKKAIDITIEWQLRNPDQTDAKDAIAEVLERRKELDIT